MNFLDLYFFSLLTDEQFIYSQCYNEATKATECPVCSPLFNQLAEPLPYAHCAQPRLICAISGKLMNEHNHPMMLPNGHVYGEKVSAD